MLSPRKTIFHAAILVAAFAIAFAPGATGHEIPNDITIQAFLKPEGHRLHLLVRIPLTAMRDFNFPEKGRDPYLDINGTAAMLPSAATLWVSDFIEVYEGDTKLGKPTVAATQLSLLSDRSFASYEQALAHVTGPPLPEDTNVVWNQTMLDAVLEYPIESDQSRFSVNPDGWWRLGLRVLTVFRFVAPNGAVRAFEFLDAPGLVRMDPRWYQAALNFVHLGFLHILGRHRSSAVPVLPGDPVPPFPLADPHRHVVHGGAFHHADRFRLQPGAGRAVVPAADRNSDRGVDRLHGARKHRRRSHRASPLDDHVRVRTGARLRLLVRSAADAAVRRLAHADLAAVVQLGVELGQLLVLVLLIPVLEVLFRFVVAERMGTIILSALVAHTGWHWMIDRGEVLSRFRFQWPVIDAAFLASLLRWLMAVVALAGLMWLVTVLGRLRAARNAEAKAEGTD